jgi:hypothetical protein
MIGVDRSKRMKLVEERASDASWMLAESAAVYDAMADDCHPPKKAIRLESRENRLGGLTVIACVHGLGFGLSCFPLEGEGGLIATDARDCAPQ